jgi:hypothetical protein
MNSINEDTWKGNHSNIFEQLDRRDSVNFNNFNSDKRLFTVESLNYIDNKLIYIKGLKEYSYCTA